MAEANDEKIVEETENIENESTGNESQSSSFDEREKNEKRLEFKLAWGSPKALVFLGGNVIMWTLAVLFFAVRIDGSSLLGSESLPVASQIMLGICSVVAVVMIALFIMSAVLFVKNKKALKETQND